MRGRLWAAVLAFCLLLVGCQTAEAPANAPTTTMITTTENTAMTTTTSSASVTDTSASDTVTTASTIQTTKTTASTTQTTALVTTTTAKPVDVNVLNGVSFAVLGDSCIAGHTLGKNNTWSALLAKKHEMTYANYGLNGSGIWISTMADREPMYTRYKEITGQPDILFVMGGVNDYYKKAALGQVGDTTATSFAGALQVLISGLKADHPNTLILFSTPYYKNAELQKYSDIVTAVCAANGIPCLNASDKEYMGVRMDDPSFRKTYCMSETDTDHLNAEGMKLVLPAYETFIAEQYYAWLQQP